MTEQTERAEVGLSIEWAVAGRLYDDEPWSVAPGDRTPTRENAVWLADQRNRRPDCTGNWQAVSRYVTPWVAAAARGVEGGA